MKPVYHKKMLTNKFILFIFIIGDVSNLVYTDLCANIHLAISISPLVYNHVFDYFARKK